ncbi:MAG TPA: S8 family serine peptidase, partial [Myxococcaceae bacterium]
MRKIPVLLALCGFALGAQALAAPPPEASPNLRFVPFEVLVKFKPGGQAMAKAQMPDVALSSPSPRFSVARSEVAASQRSRPGDAEAETRALLERLRRRDDVEYAQLNYLFDFALTPNDPLYAQQWHYPMISLPYAWDITRGSSTTGLAILDSGRTAHPDLAGRWSPVEFNASAPGTPATDNGNWRHGTHVASIAGGATNNYNGGAGVCHNCRMLNVKVGDTTTGISLANVANGIHWAVDNGARVINMSFETASACSQTAFPALREAIDRAVYNGVTVVAAAGNNAVNVANVTPASCPGVLSVAAIDRNSNLAGYSSRGTGIGISAPGGGSFYGAGIGCPADASSGFNPNDFAGAVAAWTTSANSGSAHCYRHLGGTSMAA